MLLAVPKYGRVKTNRILNSAGFSVEDDRRPSQRQRKELVGKLQR